LKGENKKMNENLNNEELDNIIVLNDEEGNEVEFEFLDLIEYEGEEYVVLLPVEEADEAGEVVILKLEDTESEDEESYVSVDDEEVLNKISKKKIITLEENALIGGFGSFVSGYYKEHGLTANIISLGVDDKFVSQGSVETQLEDCGLEVENLKKAIEG
jgi:deoxyxylulose-5-phosphate synthase